MSVARSAHALICLSPHLEAFRVYGPRDACVRGLREVAEAGAELILLKQSSTKPSRWSAWWPRSCPSSRDALPLDQRFCPLASGEEGYGGLF